MSLKPFHLAIPVNNIEESRDFYTNILGFKEGRSDNKWVDYNFFGHQLVIHLDSQKSISKKFNSVDAHQVPVPHFGVVLDWEEWKLFSEKIKKLKIDFLIKPYIRFKGKVGEQATMFFLDPSGNALEFKSFRNPNQLFEK
jgi:extradiol dioxygenase family protein